ncbi:DnaB Replicative DNA helicase [uncultured Caudovirales phage]|uniref:DnaB Replicative DNA helicase n=1 Tax=uncultured Caudovirales phage TaxID=2100421 RepID=A0A6J5RGR4_9CAUD|nr:DnaB Replicative DNA helicase [uncultured Caudovirales phage]
MSNNIDLVILKSLITNKKNALDFANECDSKLFAPEVWNFANLIISYIKTFKDIPTLRVIIEKLSKGNNDKLIDSITKTWNSLDDIKIDDREFKHDLEKLKKRFAEKQISSIKDSLSKLDPANIDISKAVTELQKTVQNIKSLSQTKTYERKTLKEAVPIFREEYNAKLNNPDFDAGLRTGYSYLDHVTDGLRPGELVLIGGESGGGKSMLLMNMALQMWMQNNTLDTDDDKFVGGNSVLYFSLEMPFKPCLNRVLSRLSGNPSKLIRNASLNPDEAIKLKKALKFITRYPHQFEIIDIPRGATMQSLETIYEEAKALYDPKIVVIDYLGLMSYEGSEMDDWLKLGKIAELTHEFSRVHNCITLSAVQLNRASGKKEEDKIGLHRVGRSALIMQNANIAIQIETRVNEKQMPDMKYHVIKNRDGELGSGTLIKNLSCGTLIDNKIDEDNTEFHDRDPDDISDKMDLLDD